MDKTNWDKVRLEFPACKRYTYLNSAEGSPISLSAANAGKQFYDEMLEHGDMCWDQWLERMEGVRSTLAEYIGATPQEIGFTTNTSHGMNLIAQFLKGKGDVITMKEEFPSSTIPWMNQSAKVTFVDPVDSAYSIENIERSLTPDVKILVSSYVQYCTGFRQDIEALGTFCKERDLIFVVNATQAIGVFPIDVVKCNIDFLMFTGLKWAASGYGIGGLFMAKKWLNKAKFPFAGWRSLVDPDNMDNEDMNFRNEASVIEAGCPHFPNIFALGGSLHLFNKIGCNNIVKRIFYLNGLLQTKLEEIGFEVIAQKEDKHRSGILIMKTSNASKIVEELTNRKVIVSARGDGLRISNTIFNNEKDIEVLINALKDIR